jgi:ABC-type multidrug transport system ATPase subunit
VKRFLLKDLHGSIQPGELTCIMGPSGAHHTSMMVALMCESVEC